MQEELVRKILLDETGQQARAVYSLSGGHVGHVYRTDTDTQSYVVKLVKAWEEPTYREEPVNDRVYGSRLSNLLPAYQLLKDSGVLVPALYASGTREGFHYEVREYLDGDTDDYSPEWFSALGKSMKKIHSSTRAYQGWVDMKEPYAESWTHAFGESIRSQLEGAKEQLGAELYESVERYVNEIAPTLTEPEEFVLSHTDGFQGVFRKEDNNWALLGVIDIEDYQFTDSRFVLAGLEIEHAFEGRTLPKEFWEGYGTSVDSHFRNLFQVYYLLVWIRVQKNEPEQVARCVERLRPLVSR